MRGVSAQFLNAVTGSHKMVSRARVVKPFQTGLNPTGTMIPILGGDVKLDSTAKVKSSLDLTTSADNWDLLQPYGNEIFVERGIDYGDGTIEWVGLGYFRINKVDQDSAPNGPVVITAQDRACQIIDNRCIYTRVMPSGTSHYLAFHKFINGNTEASLGDGGVWHYNTWWSAACPIIFDAYDGTTTITSADITFDDSIFDPLESLANSQNATIRFDASGQLRVVSREVSSASPVWTIGRGHIGTLVSVSRSVDRAGVYNVVSAYGSDTATPVPNNYAYNTNTHSPLYWGSDFGPVPRFYASPLLHTNAETLAAAQTVLSQYTGLPYAVSAISVPNPALEPLDVIAVGVGKDGTTENHVIDQVTVPLTAEDPVQIVTRTLNAVEDS